MPDGDGVHYGPATKKLGQAYDKLLEQQALPEIAFDVQSELAALIRKYGNSSRELIEQSAELIGQAIGAIQKGHEYHPDYFSDRINEFSEQLLGHRRGLPLAVDTCKAQLLDLAVDVNVDEVRNRLADNYIWRIYNADFAESLPLYFHDPRTDMTQDRLDGLLHQLRYEMQSYVDELANRFLRVSDLKHLKRVNRTNIDFDNESDDDINAGLF